MQTLPPEVMKLVRDRNVRIGISVTAAVLYLLAAAAAPGGVRSVLVALPLAVAIALGRRVPIVSLALGVVALLAAGGLRLAEAGDPGALAPLAAVVIPILVVALDDRPWMRRAAWALAAAILLAAMLWIAADFGSPGLALPVALLLAIPLSIALVWRRAEWRGAVLAFVRNRMPTADDAAVRFRWTVIAAAVFYLVCVALDVASGNPGIVLAALPLAAALPWATVKPDLAVGLVAVGLLVTAVTSIVSTRLGTGETLSLLSTALPVTGAALHGSVVLRRLTMVLVAVFAVVATAVSGSLGVGALVVALGALAFLAAFAWQQRRASGGLRERLSESRSRQQRAERDVLLEQERTRLARDVHDVVAHSLAVVIAQADGARYAAEANPATVGPALEAIADTARDALGEVRTMLHDLRTPGENGRVPGAADLPALVEGLRALGVDVDESVFGEPREQDDAAALACYRIAQEALTNALRHGRRDAPIGFELDWGDRQLVLVVRNAVPDVAREVSERAGHGIEGMRERAVLAGGECTAGIGSNGLFRVRASLPVAATRRDDAPAAPSAASRTPEDVLALMGLDPVVPSA